MQQERTHKGFLGTEDLPWMSLQQKQRVREMRIIVASIHPFPMSTVAPFEELCGDVRLLRFLEGNNNDPALAAHAFTGALAWRGQHGMDDIRNKLVGSGNWRDDLHSYPEALVPFKSDILEHLLLQLNFSYTNPSGEHRGGHLVTIEHTGLGDPVKLLEKLSLEDYLDFTKHNMEHKAVLLDRLSRERGYLVKMVAVRDMTKLGRRHVGPQGVSLMTAALKMMQGAYPEVIENIFILNAPWVFACAWRLAKPLIAPRTLEKIRILGPGDLGTARQQLVELCGAEKLPARYGGVVRDEDCLPIKVLLASGLSIPPHRLDPTLSGTIPQPSSFLQVSSSKKHSCAFEMEVKNHADFTSRDTMSDEADAAGGSPGSAGDAEAKISASVTSIRRETRKTTDDRNHVTFSDQVSFATTSLASTDSSSWDIVKTTGLPTGALQNEVSNPLSGVSREEASSELTSSRSSSFGDEWFDCDNGEWVPENFHRLHHDGAIEESKSEDKSTSSGILTVSNSLEAMGEQEAPSTRSRDVEPEKKGGWRSWCRCFAGQRSLDTETLSSCDNDMGVRERRSHHEHA